MIFSGGKPVPIENADRALATVSKLSVGEYKFKLTVADEEGLQTSATMTVTVKESKSKFSLFSKYLCDSSSLAHLITYLFQIIRLSRTLQDTHTVVHFKTIIYWVINIVPTSTGRYENMREYFPVREKVRQF